MLLDLYDDGLSRGLNLFRTREIDHKIMLEQVVKPGMRIFDIGGNIGYYPLMELSLLGGTGHVIVVEPVQQNVDLLRRNLALNHYLNVDVISAAVSSTRSAAKPFYISSHSNLGTFHPDGISKEFLVDQIDVSTTTVSELASKYGPPDLLRMDIEGHEVDVFGSMVADIGDGRYRPAIIFETHSDRYGPNNDMESVLKRLFDLGYSTKTVSSVLDISADAIAALGYSRGQRIATDAVHRTLFSDISRDDAIKIICHNPLVRTVLITAAPG
jgi:FkbM family methyltransferase